MGLVPLGTAICQKALTTFVLPNKLPCVAFVDAHQHVGRYFFQDNRWKFDDLTNAAHSPLALEGSKLTSFVLRDGSPHIIFIDQRHHVDQLFYQDKWRFDDLTTAAHAPVAVQESGLSSFVMPDGSPHIAFIDGKAHVDQLFFQDNRWNFDDVIASAKTARSALAGSELSTFVLPDGLPQIAFVDKSKQLIQLFFQDHMWRAATLRPPDDPSWATSGQ